MINTQHGFLEFSIVIINPDTRSLAHLLPLKNFNERTNHSSISPFNFTFYIKNNNNNNKKTEQKKRYQEGFFSVDVE